MNRKSKKKHLEIDERSRFPWSYWKSYGQFFCKKRYNMPYKYRYFADISRNIVLVENRKRNPGIDERSRVPWSSLKSYDQFFCKKRSSFFMFYQDRKEYHEQKSNTVYRCALRRGVSRCFQNSKRPPLPGEKCTFVPDFFFFKFVVECHGSPCSANSTHSSRYADEYLHEHDTVTRVRNAR